MASLGEIGWQSDKTLVECMRYMLDNEIATDVCFEVGPPNGATVEIRVHKFMLISRCPVFEAMMSSEMSETENKAEAKIRIVDISAEVFKLLLNFMYCDDVSIDHRSAPALLYAAKKYFLPKLTECCSKYLHSILNSNNVCSILALSFTFDVKDLKSQCIEFVANNSEAVLNAEDLVTLSRECLEAILKTDRMMSGPSTLFNSCVKWAKHQLQKIQYSAAPNDRQIRETLGSLLYEIPFPTISSTEFANVIGESDILTGEEKSTIYYYLASGKGRGKLKFSMENKHEHMVNLVPKIKKGLWPHSKCSTCGNFKKSSFEINFKTNNDIMLTGIGLYKGHDGSEYDFDIQIIQVIQETRYRLPAKRKLNENCILHNKTPTESLESQAHDPGLFTGAKRIIPYANSSTTFKVSFDEPVSIDQERLYKVSVLAHKTIGYYGKLCKEVTVDDVTFTFDSVSSNPSRVCYDCYWCGVESYTPTCVWCNATCFRKMTKSVLYGQIPQLYFISM